MRLCGVERRALALSGVIHHRFHSLYANAPASQHDGSGDKSEILFLANLDPNKFANKLSNSEKKCLGQSVSVILKRAFEQNGATVAKYQTAVDPGRSQGLHYVYGKEGKPCPACQSAIKRIIQKQRSTYYCPQCQVLK